ncbi:MAG: recombination-associated protein RdgC [Alphaproteobacteria bacterium]
MGFLSAASTIVRYHAPVPKRLDRDAIVAQVDRRAFREHDEDGLPKAESFGWVAIHDPLVTTFEAHDVFLQQYLVLGFRHDRRVAPAKLVMLERRRLEEERRRADGLERLPRPVRREIKEEVASRLLLQALPSPSLFECAWNLDTGTLWFTGKARAAREAFQSLFHETCGVVPAPVIPYLAAERVGLAGAVVDAIRRVEPATFHVARGEAAAAAGGAA